MKFLRFIIRFYLSKFPITEGKKYVYQFAKKYFLPSDYKIFANTKHGFYLKLNLQNPEHLHYYFYMSHDERYEINNLKKIINENDVCWDIGANIGFYSFLFASIVKNGEVISFEPVEEAFSDLKAGKALNNYQNIKLCNFALGSEKKNQKIFFDKKELSMGTASFINSDSFVNSALVEINMIDNIYKLSKIPDLIKIDVEGFQKEVIKGGSYFFENYSPLIMIEIDRDTDKWIEDYFIRLNYKFFKFNKTCLNQVESIFNNGRNILFCKLDNQYFERIKGILDDY